ncbi:hypothetical protein [Methylobacterium persicinum]|jgi:hypothetical protein|uniref:Uncharacterized protein n=1 Tax=Methylobacterium persicinum TaxID=374426 RepID=A0ABU0HLA4_9HYPH|nr:hypothetical protein [Methylobacterium persicinum]MDQ0442618.1 hypothetical protein [Methylobacterium persicinum]
MSIGKRFGRKIPLPPTMKIKLDLLEMAHADALVVQLKELGISRDEFFSAISRSMTEGDLSRHQAKMLTSRFA